eukprot:TRINITY_DN11727_c0_g1_i1.p1 TRINITY_DN11727_c0_g1~~TRINITY_DN11727_c0_g1_i1.p1  ORF type:complete len:835 (+),score=223.99 TRINITY_DN11727_c0_g1_i1:80-2584(+)
MVSAEPELGDHATADLIFDVGGKEIACHRAVLSARSEYLRDYLNAQKDCARIYVSNAPVEATEVALRHIYCPTAPLAQLVPEDEPWEKVLKIWEVALRFGLTELAQRCTERLRLRLTCGNVCQLLATTYKYPSAGDGAKGGTAAFKRTCLSFIVNHHQKVSNTRYYKELMETQRIRREVESALRQHKRQRAAQQPTSGVPVFEADLAPRPSQPPRGGDTVFSRPNGAAAPLLPPAPRRSGAAAPAAAAPGHDDSSREGDAVSLPSRRHAGGSVCSIEQPLQPLPAHPGRRTPPPPGSAPRSPERADSGGRSGLPEVGEPVYDQVPVFHAEPSRQNGPADHLSVASDVYDPAMYGQPEAARRAGPLQQPTPPGSPSRSPAKRLFALMHGSGGTPRPQPAGTVCVRLAVCQHASAPPPANGWRMATTHEARAQHDELLNLMGELDGGFLGSYALADGKVDGPGFGVPLRFAAGEFSDHCGFRVEARDEPMPAPSEPAAAACGSTAAAAPPSAAHPRRQTSLERVFGAAALGPVGDKADKGDAGTAKYQSYLARHREQERYLEQQAELLRGGPQPAADALQRDALRLVCVELQQELRLTQHELSLFKTDWTDWEGKMREAARLKEEEEGRLRARIDEQHRQLLSAACDASFAPDKARLLGEMRDEARDAEVQYSTEIRGWEHERRDLLGESTRLTEQGSAAARELAQLDGEAAAVAAEIEQLGAVRGMIEKELRENEAYETFSKQYVCAVRVAEQELRERLLHADATPTQQQLDDMYRALTEDRRGIEREARRLTHLNDDLTDRVDREVRHIQQIRAFLDETEGVQGAVTPDRVAAP